MFSCSTFNCTLVKQKLTWKFSMTEWRTRETSPLAQLWIPNKQTFWRYSLFVETFVLFWKNSQTILKCLCPCTLWGLIVGCCSRARVRHYSPCCSVISHCRLFQQHCGLCGLKCRANRQVYESSRVGYTLINLTDALCVITFHLLLFSCSSLYRELL